MILNSNLLLHGISEAIVVLDADGYIFYSNPAVTVLTGFSSEDLLNKHLSVFYTHPGDNIKAEYELGLALKTGIFISEGWRAKKDGSHCWCEMMLSPLLDDKQSFAGYTCVLRDVSEKKKKEIELRESEEREV